MHNSLFYLRFSIITAFAVVFAVNFEWPQHTKSPNPTSSWNSEAFSIGQVPCLPSGKSKTFHPEDKNFPDNPYMLMAAAHAAYRFWPGKQNRILRSWGFTQIQSFNQTSTSTNGFAAEHNDFFLLAFRGTQEPSDLITDFTVTLSPAESPSAASERVHLGFKIAADSVESSVLQTARNAQFSRKPLFLVGHSLGGAIALLSAQTLQKENLPFNSVWTFGAPKLGNDALIQDLKNGLGEKWKRFNHPQDPIPALPLTPRDEKNSKQWAETLAPVLPFFKTLSENADYEDSPISRATSGLSRKAFSERTLKEIARGFLEHLPRAYVCNLSKDQLPL
ncbi:MAG: hypothetical protein RIR26_799 [Pseudomonadota bacterium]